MEVADILRAHGAAYSARHPLSAVQAAVMRRLVAGRTAAYARKFAAFFMRSP